MRTALQGSFLLFMVTVMGVSALGTTAHAQSGEVAPALTLEEDFRPIRFYDYALMPLSGLAGSYVGFLMGGLSSVFVCGTIDDCSDGARSTSDGEQELFLTMGAAGSLGVSSLALWAYSGLRDLRGSFTGSVVGYAVGLGLGVVTILQASSLEGQVAGFGMVFSLPSVLGSIGYLAFAGDSKAPQSTSLFHLDSAEGLRLGLPAVNVSVAQEDMRISMPLLGGQF